MLDNLYKEIDNCKNCELYNLEYNKLNTNNLCYGKLLTNHKIKNINSKKILLIGMNPSYRRFDQKRMTFEGVSPSDNLNDIKTSGDFFWFVLKQSKFVNYDIYITNLVKCSTDYNEMLKDVYVNSCKFLLLKEINIIKPDYIICLGKFVSMHIKRFRLNNKIFYINHPSFYFRFKSEKSVELELKEFNDLYNIIENDKNTLGSFIK